MVITKPTVLVLGAGASAPLKFPLGKELTRLIVDSIRSSDSNSGKSFVSRLRACGQPAHSLGRALAFGKSLGDSALDSVDAFLEIRPNFIPIGKPAIAMKLPHEDPGGIYSEENRNWYKYFRNRINTRSVEEFQKHKLSVITYKLLTDVFSRAVHGVTISDDRLVYVADRVNNRVQVFEPDGTFVQEAFVDKRTRGFGSVFELAFSKDRGQQFLYNPNGMNQSVDILLRDSLEVVARFGQGGRYPGQFYAVHSIAVDSRGNIYTGETLEGKRLQRFVYQGIGG